MKQTEKTTEDEKLMRSGGARGWGWIEIALDITR